MKLRVSAFYPSFDDALPRNDSSRWRIRETTDASTAVEERIESMPALIKERNSVLNDAAGSDAWFRESASDVLKRWQRVRSA